MSMLATDERVCQILTASCCTCRRQRTTMPCRPGAVERCDHADPGLCPMCALRTILEQQHANSERFDSLLETQK